MDKINIVTPLSRPENLPAIAKSLTSSHPIRWWIVVDHNSPPKSPEIKLPPNVEVEIHISPYTAIAGHGHRNWVLQQLGKDCNEWFYSVDDDNILHPGFLDQLAMIQTPGITVEQIHKDGSPRLKANLVILNHIDTAQFAFRVNIRKNMWFKPDRYDADGLFISELYAQNPGNFTIINKPLSYYNYLR